MACRVGLWAAVAHLLPGATLRLGGEAQWACLVSGGAVGGVGVLSHDLARLGQGPSHLRAAGNPETAPKGGPPPGRLLPSRGVPPLKGRGLGPLGTGCVGQRLCAPPVGCGEAWPIGFKGRQTGPWLRRSRRREG